MPIDIVKNVYSQLIGFKGIIRLIGVLCLAGESFLCDAYVAIKVLYVSDFFS